MTRYSTPTAVTLADEDPEQALALLEAIVGPLPRLELMSSVSWMTPEVLAAPIGDGRRLPLDQDEPAEHHLAVARAALSLWLFRRGHVAMLPAAEPIRLPWETEEESQDAQQA